MRHLLTICLLCICILAILATGNTVPDVETFDTAQSIDKSNKSVAIAVLMRKPIDLPLWLRHHRDMGVAMFFIRLEDSPGWDEFLKTQTDVVYEIANSDPDNNYETLQSRQITYVNQCLAKCPSHIKWLFHIDADELLDGSLSFLHSLPNTTKTVHIQNVEAVFDGSEDTCFAATKFMHCAKSAPCRSYANGKAGGRTETGVAIVGPHNFKHPTPHSDLEVPFETLHVLHFDSCSFGAWSEKFQHLSKSSKIDAIPFPYYKASVAAAAEAYELYKKHTMPDLDSVDAAVIYTRTLKSSKN